MSVPTLLVAAPGSGHGKTTVVCGLAAALRRPTATRAALDVRAFKAGPDYLDPTWHAVATGRPSRNIDAWMTSLEGVRASFARGAAGGDLALIEGVMGLFDGRDPRTLEGSGAELAQLLGVPVLLVVDASGMARTAAAVVEGLARHVPGVHVAGVIFNRVGSRGHTAILAEALAGSGIPVLGGLPKAPALTLPERHLGLHAADTSAGGDAGALIAAIADHVAAHVDLDAVRALAAPVPLAGTRRDTSALSPSDRVRIGVARDAAFSFYYEDNLDLLAAAGAELVPFSPLADAALPEVDGLYFGGGYPELHADTLAANAALRAAVRSFPGPIYAECGGLMFLGESLDGRPMCGALPIRTKMGERLRALGYREVVTTRDTVLGPAGTRFRGHEFHYSALDGTPDLAPAYAMTGRRGAGVEGWARGNVLGSYVHAHFGSNPGLAGAFVRKCGEDSHRHGAGGVAGGGSPPPQEQEAPEDHA